MNCACGLHLYGIMTDGTAWEYILLGTGCMDAIRWAERRGWHRANRCDLCGMIYEPR